jgi:acetamidase/formamidase
LAYTPTREQYVYIFGGAAPAMRVRPGTALRLWSDDAFCGVLRSVDDLSGQKVDLRFVNPQTGPFYVEGAQLDRARNTVVFAARHSDHRVELPVEPMLGTMGVAPAGGEVRSSLVPERFGGNMDTPSMRAGAPCSLVSTSRGRCSRSGTGTIARARARPVAQLSRVP